MVGWNNNYYKIIIYFPVNCESTKTYCKIICKLNLTQCLAVLHSVMQRSSVLVNGKQPLATNVD